jgi:hypothetical protein
VRWLGSRERGPKHPPACSGLVTPADVFGSVRHFSHLIQINKNGSSIHHRFWHDRASRLDGYRRIRLYWVDGASAHCPVRVLKSITSPVGTRGVLSPRTCRSAARWWSPAALGIDSLWMPLRSPLVRVWLAGSRSAGGFLKTNQAARIGFDLVQIRADHTEKLPAP